MANILSAMHSSAGALSAFEQALQVTQNNVSNAATPGFVRQSQSLLAMAFSPRDGLSGGVRAGEILSARVGYADQAVRNQLFLQGKSQQDVNSASSLQSNFDVTGNSGIPSALNGLFKTFSAWAQSPDDAVTRQSVIERAADVASAFNQTANNLVNVERQTEQSVYQTVDTINTLATRLQTLNGLIKRGTRGDPGLDAQLHTTLEDLSQYASITALEQEDGSVNVLINGQSALVAGDEAFPISARMVQSATPAPVYTEATPTMHIFSSDGQDITASTTTGQLGSLLDTRNRILPSYLGDAWQPGDLNRMAAQFADRVNALLTSGTAPDGSPGIGIFSYAANPTDTARTLTVDQKVVTAAALGASQTGQPAVSNGIPLALAALASPQNDTDKIDGASYSQFYGRLAARSGSAMNDAENDLKIAQSAVAQSRNLRQQLSGVSLDEEAALLIQFQRAYEANSRLISVLSQLSEEAINILR